VELMLTAISSRVDERELLDHLPSVQELKAEFGGVKPCLRDTQVELLDELHREL
jgi:hypothetical protein